MVKIDKSFDSYWKKLDNFATFYASTTTAYNPNVYRLSVKLKSKIDKDILAKALNDTLIMVPSFNVKLRKGFFWYYLEYNKERPIIKEDDHFSFTIINTKENNYFLFKVTYFEKRINIDFCHVLTDGTGALSFLEALVTNYLQIRYPKKIKKDIIIGPELLTKNEMSMDSFLKYSTIKKEYKAVNKDHDDKSFIIHGDKLNKENTNVIIGTISVSQMKNIAKEKGVSITAYLASLLVYSIYEHNYKYTNSSEPISICIPVNLRNYFPSASLNNFFSTIIISIPVSKSVNTFEQILDIVSLKIKEELREDVLLSKFQFFVSLQQNIMLRVIPLFVKNLLLRSVYSVVSNRGATSAFSNLGIIKMSNEVNDYIDKFDVITYNDYSSPIKVGIVSFEDKLSIAFSSVIEDSEIQKGFFTVLSKNNIEVKIASSIIEQDLEVK